MIRRFASERVFLLVLELIIVVPTLAVFILLWSYDTRTKLWVIGAENGWNSNPKLRIYYYANHQEPPAVPLVWSQTLADSTLAIAILGAFVCATRAAFLFLGITATKTNVLYDICLSGLWTYSATAQNSGDMTDTRHLSPQPWYMEKSCAAVDGEGRSSCLLVKTALFSTFICIVFYFLRSAFSILGLAYQCGEQNVVDRIGDWIFGPRIDLLTERLWSAGVSFNGLKEGDDSATVQERPNEPLYNESGWEMY